MSDNAACGAPKAISRATIAAVLFVSAVYLTGCAAETQRVPVTVPCRVTMPARPLMPTESLQKTDAAATQSIMLQQRGGETTPRLKVKRLKRVMPVGDPLQGVRDEIVRKRRFEEGRPLQPLPPPYPRM